MTFPVAVIIPSYNRATLLPETLASILSQSLPPAEIIVVDDGSTDSTEEVVHAFSPKVRYLRIENSGVCRARNVGVAASSSPWIAFCDSDDLWRPDRLELQSRLAALAPDAAFQFCNFVHVRDGAWSAECKFSQAPTEYWRPARHLLAPNLWLFTEPLYARLLTFQPVFPSTIFMTRALFDQVGGFQNSLGRVKGEDFEFVLRCAQFAPSAAVAKPLVGIRKHSGNFSHDQLEVTLGELRILRHALEHHPAAASLRSAMIGQISLRSAQAASGAFLRGDMHLVRQLLASVPTQKRSGKLRFKSLVAHSPAWLAHPTGKALVVLSSFASGQPKK